MSPYNNIISELNFYKPGISIAKILPRKTLFRLRILTGTTTLLLLILLLGSLPSNLPVDRWHLRGVICVVASMYLLFLLISCYYNYFYNRGLDSKINNSKYFSPVATYDLISVISLNQSDLTFAFLSSTFGQHITKRVDLSPEVVQNFLNSKRVLLPINLIALNPKTSTSVIDLVEVILHYDKNFIYFLSANKISVDYLRGATKIYIDYYHQQKRSKRWWSRDLLSSVRNWHKLFFIPPITGTLKINARSLSSEHQNSKYVQEVISLLASKSGLNIFLTGHNNNQLLEIVEAVVYQLKHANTLGKIFGKQFVMLDIENLFTSNDSANLIAERFENILLYCAKYGTVLVLPDIKLLDEYCNRIGLRLLNELEEFLVHERISVIALSTIKNLEKIDPADQVMLKRFTSVIITPPTPENLIESLQSDIFKIESASGLIFSYQALLSIAKISLYENYSETSYATAISLIQKIINGVVDKGKKIISDSDCRNQLNIITDSVNYLVPSTKTTLSDLEKMLQTKVIGQPRAITNVTETLKRQLFNENKYKPFASMLFLGGSGVGKMTLAKALGTIYEHSDVVEFDMNNYRNFDSFEVLFGNDNSSGDLIDKINYHKSGIICLTNFEKASLEIQKRWSDIFTGTNNTTNKLFLQSYIVIATSTIGSNLLAKTTVQRQQAPTLDNEIYEYIVKKELLSHEILKSFDSVVLFDSLSFNDELVLADSVIFEVNQATIEKGYLLEVPPELITKIITLNYDAHKGLRPVRHILETALKNSIATKIIRGQVKPGNTIKISADDLKSVFDLENTNKQ